MNAETVSSAWQLLKEAYQYQMGEDYDMAVELYQRSIDLHPTAEAYTFLGWTYHFQGRVDDAIAECKKRSGLTRISATLITISDPI